MSVRGLSFRKNVQNVRETSREGIFQPGTILTLGGGKLHKEERLIYILHLILA
jgi:hypothetical protein